MCAPQLFYVSLLGVLLVANPFVFAAKPEGSDKVPARSVSVKPSSNTSTAKTLAASQQVDKLIKADYVKHNIKPNKITSDEIFLRRIYLDVVGRIPSYDESIAFLDSKDANKRSQLIDTLLDSEGYVSHNFNYWADLLRLKTRMRFAPSKPYLDFVKDALRENKPYDQFVRDLVTAEGYTWDNGAAGYYLRDPGMPLDNMSNTAQVFLGTQLVCAQCHDHPFDSWTQKQYYQMAAFTYGVQTRDRKNEKSMELRKMQRGSKIDRNVYRAANRIMRPLAYRVNETDRALRLPKDYQYNNASPKDQIDPATIFGEEVELKEGDSPKDIYARWMTSPKNPRFTTVIANRLWKRVMGVGLVEPVDDFRDGIDPSNPELMKFLVDQMVNSGFDVKQYLRVLYNSKTYQREVSTEELSADKTYYFPGPVLRRMTSEQLWDSLLTMTIPYVDQRKGLTRGYGRYGDGAELVNTDLKEIIKRAKVDAKRRVAQVEYNKLTKDLQKDLRVASKSKNREKVRELKDKMNEIRKKVYGSSGDRKSRKKRDRKRKSSRKTDPRWSGFSASFVRASEVESPAKPGHFLRQFGQSDRETIENANADATVPQVLTLLNGPMFSQLSNKKSILYKNILATDSNEEKIDVIFLSILNRRPTTKEKSIAISQLTGDTKQGVSDVIWALLNTRQFMFVQ